MRKLIKFLLLPDVFALIVVVSLAFAHAHVTHRNRTEHCIVAFLASLIGQWIQSMGKDRQQRKRLLSWRQTHGPMVFRGPTAFSTDK
jgi:hypothetical protein